jgi:hypothetical protein
LRLLRRRRRPLRPQLGQRRRASTASEGDCVLQADLLAPALTAPPATAAAPAVQQRDVQQSPPRQESVDALTPVVTLLDTEYNAYGITEIAASAWTKIDKGAQTCNRCC